MSAPYTIHWGYCGEETFSSFDLAEVIQKVLSIPEQPIIFGDNYDGPDDRSNGLSEEELEQIENAGLGQ
jgi:hypothetical protein